MDGSEAVMELDFAAGYFVGILSAIAFYAFNKLVDLYYETLGRT